MRPRDAIDAGRTAGRNPSQLAVSVGHSHPIEACRELGGRQHRAPSRHATWIGISPVPHHLTEESAIHGRVQHDLPSHSAATHRPSARRKRAQSIATDFSEPRARGSLTGVDNRSRYSRLASDDDDHATRSGSPLLPLELPGLSFRVHKPACGQRTSLGTVVMRTHCHQRQSVTYQGRGGPGPVHRCGGRTPSLLLRHLRGSR